MFNAALQAASDECDALKARVKELEAALTWYADAMHINFCDSRYDSRAYSDLPVFVKDTVIDEVETGARARDALRGVEGESEK